MNIPKENDKVMVAFMYLGKLEESPATYHDGRFIISFYQTYVPVNPVNWWYPENKPFGLNGVIDLTKQTTDPK